MAKRGETRPWRMTYQWPGAGGGTQAHISLEDARRAARQQVEIVGGMSGERNCAALVTHRGGMDLLTPEHYRACPDCGHWTVWDIQHLPHAWRHEWDSRWCEPIESATEPILPTARFDAPDGLAAL